jgi:hypothetical protein
MAKAKEDPERIQIQEIKAQLAALTAKLKQYESNAALDDPQGGTLVSDGLRLSQEVEMLRRENDGLRKENEALKKQLHRGEADDQTACP